MLEPRRVAARAATERLAEQLGEPVGQSAGYRIRGESKVSAKTRIEVVTEGILTRMLQSDPELPGIGAILFDEVHERSIHTDLGLALCLEVQEALRPDLRLVAMSATLDTAQFARIMGDAPIIESAGRVFPVETVWLDRPWRSPGQARRGMEQQAAGLVRQAIAGTEGDILVFLPGAGEIRRTAAALEGLTTCAVSQLYGALPFAEQRRVLAATDNAQRRIILATAIAETSLTVPGVRVVVDCGFARRARTDPATGMTRLVTVPVSRAEADQRRGRAGRLAPGWCYRMWTKGEEGALPLQPPAEIMETDLAPLALDLAQWGSTSPDDMRFLDPPPEAAFSAARHLLQSIAALDGEGRITDHGRAIAERPLHPRLAHMLIAAKADGLEGEAALLAALLSERDPLSGASGADLLLRLEALLGDRSARGADPAVCRRITSEAKRLSKARPDRARMREHAAGLLSLAYPDRIALRRSGDVPRYLLANGRGAVLHASDALANMPMLVAANLEDGREARIRLAAALSEADMRTAHGARIRTEQNVAWSTRERQVTARIEERLDALVLSSRIWRDAPTDRQATALLAGIREMGIDNLPWSAAAKALRTRSAWLHSRNDTIDLPNWSDATLTGSLEDWLAPHLSGQRTLGDLSNLDLAGLLRTSLSWDDAQNLDRLAPANIEIPTGRQVPVDYGHDIPRISVRVQDVFGLTRHPMIGAPPTPLAIELLSPANRPVQLTSDLPGFWKSSYADVRKDMRARYPKHNWPEDPATAAPGRGRASIKS
jgi:ATP-dependent helicase HrpB